MHSSNLRVLHSFVVIFLIPGKELVSVRNYTFLHHEKMQKNPQGDMEMGRNLLIMNADGVHEKLLSPDLPVFFLPVLVMQS